MANPEEMFQCQTVNCGCIYDPDRGNRKSKIAKGYVRDKKVYLLLPQTFMNESGRAVQLCMNFYKIDINNVLVVVDDIALAFGDLRIRSKGSSGGHNGLKSIEDCLNSQNYARLRIGIELEDERQKLSSYVLDKFTKQREKQLLEINQEAQRAIEEATRSIRRESR